MIEVSGLNKSYGDRQAIRQLNFKINKGEVVGFLGPNGAGKSTTMKIITGYMAPTSGEVKVAGFDVFESPIEVKKRIGYLPETPPVYGDMRVEDYLVYVARLRGVVSQDLDKQVNDSLAKTNLTEVRGRLIQNLSKGFKQRVGLAQALVSNPDILILDEPTAGLDPKQVAEVRDLIKGLRGQHTIVLSTHILPEVQASCERIIIINEGQIVAEDSIQSLMTRIPGQLCLQVRVRKPSSGLHEQLEALQGVAAVKGKDSQFSIEIDGKESTIEEISKQIVGSGSGLLELRPETAALEDIFIQLTSAPRGN